MPPLEHCSLARLAEVVTEAQEEIICEWRDKASVLLRELNLDHLTLTDHLPVLIAEISEDLRNGREAPVWEDASGGISSSHGQQRYRDGLDVGEVVAEYNLLRVAFITIAERHRLYLVGEAARIINARLDRAVRAAVMAFAAQQARIRQEQADEHLAFLAHDLRTPLNAVSLGVGELRESIGAQTLADTEDLFDLLERNLQRVESQIQRVLETSARPAEGEGSFLPQRRTFELWPLVQRLIHDFRPLAAKHEVSISNEVPQGLTIFADASLIAQVYQNLLGNAFKYTEGGRVVLQARREGDAVTCVIKDNGVGIPPDMLPHVFEKLATDPAKSGTGLGLAIVRGIIEAHDGTVGVESTPGSGATFRFTLPDSATK